LALFNAGTLFAETIRKVYGTWPAALTMRDVMPLVDKKKLFITNPK